jgi:hypothetical protein
MFNIANQTVVTSSLHSLEGRPLEAASVLKERDYVRLKKPIPGANVPVGSHGRLIYICQSPTLSYLVEFFDSHQSFGEFSLLAADDYLEKRST